MNGENKNKKQTEIKIESIIDRQRREQKEREAQFSEWELDIIRDFGRSVHHIAPFDFEDLQKMRIGFDIPDELTVDEWIENNDLSLVDHFAKERNLEFEDAEKELHRLVDVFDFDFFTQQGEI